MMAAMTLGAVPKRQRRRWTGWIRDEHFWRGRRVILPNGVVAEVYGVLRGQAAVCWPDLFWVEGTRRDVVPVDQLTVYKHPAAIVLGKLKRGGKEKFSECKQITSRLNGARPVRAGHRPRGRPRKVAAATATGIINLLAVVRPPADIVPRLHVPTPPPP